LTVPAAHDGNEGVVSATIDAGCLQATFVPDEGALAWWGVDDITAAAAALGLPEGRPSNCRLGVPVDGRVRARTIRVRLADLDDALPALRALDPAAVAPSVRAWRDAAALGENADIDALAQRMPAAAHALLNPDGTAIASAPALLTQFRRAVGTRHALSGVRIRATLRPYQIHGVAWLRSLPEHGGGGVLADEMGLGKTLQAICLLALSRQTEPHLVVCPTSLIGNWCRELTRFAPTTSVLAYHGSSRSLPESLPAGAVVVAGYTALRQDGTLTSLDWDVVILDEAQQIKNPEAMVTRAAARLSARLRVAMTGTPVENRFDELWSILNVTNPGVLGSRARFRQRFAIPIESRRSATAAAALKTLVAPYILRRLKADVVSELPPKQYSTVVCTLTEEQVGLYSNAVEQAFSAGLGHGIERKGRVLALLTALKQICNHPAQYLREPCAGQGRSGKFDRAVEMLAEIVDDGDRALVFTQYRLMGELLAQRLAEVLGGPAPFLHGGLGVGARDDMVRAFQEEQDSPPILLLSLRAAGFGLNLTRAAHVMHYDRWWNPAVEEQATDRAHRIGQHRTLTVHTLVTEGTIEDRIARMHETKRGLADAIAGDTEAALTTMSDEDLHSALELDLGAWS
jgi:SNF2 family DNA or RNA helicase